MNYCWANIKTIILEEMDRAGFVIGFWTLAKNMEVTMVTIRKKGFERFLEDKGLALADLNGSATTPVSPNVYPDRSVQLKSWTSCLKKPNSAKSL